MVSYNHEPILHGYGELQIFWGHWTREVWFRASDLLKRHMVAEILRVKHLATHNYHYKCGHHHFGG